MALSKGVVALALVFVLLTLFPAPLADQSGVAPQQEPRATATAVNRAANLSSGATTTIVNHATPTTVNAATATTTNTSSGT